MIKRMMRVATMLTCSLMVFTHVSCSSEKAQVKILQKELAEMRKGLPKEMAPGVSMTKVSIDDGKILSYEFKIADSATEMKAKLSDEVQFKGEIIVGLKANSATSTLIEKGYVYHYIYLDERGDEIYECSISKKDF